METDKVSSSHLGLPLKKKYHPDFDPHMNISLMVQDKALQFYLKLQWGYDDKYWLIK